MITALCVSLFTYVIGVIYVYYQTKGDPKFGGASLKVGLMWPVILAIVLYAVIKHKVK